MRRALLFLIILCLAAPLAGCTNTGAPVSVRGNVVVSKDTISAPVEGAFVRLAGQEVTTASNGGFQFAEVPQGTYTLEVRSARPTSTSSAGKAEGLDGALLYTTTVRVGSRDLTVPVTVRPLGEMVRFGPSSWQLAFYAEPPQGALITEAVVTPPAPRDPQAMTPHKYPPQWHVWWNITAPEPGLYAYRVVLNNGTTEEFGFQIDENVFQDIQIPSPTAPANGDVVNSLTPTVSFVVPGTPSVVYIRLRASDEQTETWYTVPDGASSFKIPAGRIQNGKTYFWAVHTVDKARPLPWTEGLSDSFSFTVSCS